MSSEAETNPTRDFFVAAVARLRIQPNEVCKSVAFDAILHALVSVATFNHGLVGLVGLVVAKPIHSAPS